MTAVDIAKLAGATTAGIFFLRGASKVVGDCVIDSPEPPLNIYNARNPYQAVDKATTSAKGDKARSLAVVGQGFNAFKNFADSNSIFSKDARSLVQAVDKVAKLDTTLGKVAKMGQFASANVNPLLCGAAAFRVLSADNKKAALQRESMSMSGMFAAEKAMKLARGSEFMKNIRASVEKSKSPCAKAALAIAEGASFVLGSIAGFDAGAKVSDSLLGIKNYR